MATATVSPVAVLKAIKSAGEATAAQAGTTRAYLNQLADEGLVVSVGVQKTGLRGRPAAVFKTTKKGSDRVRRASK